jgi:hypothetical protein
VSSTARRVVLVTDHSKYVMEQAVPPTRHVVDVWIT